MKQCPVCHKQYNNDQNFCADDGSALVAMVADVQEKPQHATTTQPVQIIQMPTKSKTGFYIFLSIVLVLISVFGFLFWLKKTDDRAHKEEEKQMAKMQAEDEEEYKKRLAAARLSDDDVKKALDAISAGSSATYRDCAADKMGLYLKRYNVWVEWQEDMPTKAHSQQNVTLAAQASINSCRQEAEALNTGKPSFDCAKAVIPTEAAICDAKDNKELAQLDMKLDNAARSARFFTSDPSRFNAMMKSWLKNRNNCGTDLDCIANAYKSTISTLNSQIEP
ncbi:hypothetical protein [Hydromonas duriensis]|uniref:Uncharacterized protein n=1 Tax=Hydromonas duriensis TaxID=1527608 RepID=A0A4R6Y8A0_9BURK|nr:hypothetical protein [Hydromonas duriensis]TDR31625.1 hypothetical protein DFR44_1087 [Hydromonas duriensis]